MAVIPFTRRRNLKGFKEPTLSNKTNLLTGEVKYAGLTVDTKPIWDKQLDIVISKAYRAFWTCRSTSEKTWGLKRRVLHQQFPQQAVGIE
jgi:hypothetical protein